MSTDDATDAGGSRAKRVLGAAAAITWLAFWLVVARIHVVRDAPVDAAFTAVFAAIPAIALVILAFRGRLGVIPTLRRTAG